MRAAMGGSTDVLETLLRHCDEGFSDTPARRAYLEATNENGWTAVHFAVTSGSATACGVLLDHGIPVGPRNSDGCSPLEVAVLDGNAAICEVLLDRGAAVNDTRRGGHSPLLMALIAGHEEVASLLRSRGAKEPSLKAKCGACICVLL